MANRAILVAMNDTPRTCQQPVDGSTTTSVAPRQPLDRIPVITLAVLTAVIHFAVNLVTPYGVHRDELLYLAMGRHLDLFRMEFPPAIAILAELSRLIPGDSVFEIRFLPALASAALVLFAAMIAAELGGRRFAQTSAALAVVTSPLFLRAGNLFQPVVFDQLAWTVGLYSLARLSRTGDCKWWMWYGIATGFALLTKFSAIFFGVATLIAVVVTRERRWLLTRWPWVAFGIVIVIGSPSLIGQLRLDLPVIQQMRDLQESQLERVTPIAFLLGQIQLGPAFLLAAGGLAWLLASAAARPFRVVGWTCAFCFLILLALKGKPYYLGPVYPALCAAGGVAIERISRRPVRIVSRGPLVILLIAYGTLLFPIGVPILSPPLMARYAVAIGAESALRTNRGELDRLPQDYADMLGWPEQVAAVAEVYNGLPPEDRARAVIIADNYGEAGAIDYYGPRYGLPPAISAAGTYWFFGPGSKPGEVAVTVGIDDEDLKPFFEDIEPAGRFTHPWSVSEERDIPIHVARRPRATLQQVWPSLKGRN